MKLIITLLSTIFLLFGCSNSDVDKKAEKNQLDNNSAFTLVEKRTVEKSKAIAYRYRHKKTGAEVVYLDDGNSEKAFAIAFKTPVVDNTGVNHVFEHSVLQGSKKYPDKDLFYKLNTRNLSTFLNAFTSTDSTAYPFSAVEENSFNNLMDIYLDAVFNPMVLNDINTLRREGVRHDINPKTGKVMFNGIVYNEMKGAFSNPYRNLYRTLNQLTYPDENTNYSFVSGGLPAEIPMLNLDQLRKTHKKYYTPTNSITILAGKLDINKKLAKLDEYFSKYDKTEKATLVLQKSPLVDKVNFEEYPAPKGSPNIYFYNYLVNRDIKLNEQQFVVSLLADYENSPLRKAFNENKFTGNFGFYNGNNAQPVINMMIQGAKKDEIKKFRQVMDQEIEKAYETGIDQKVVEVALRDYRKDDAKSLYSKTRAQDLISQVSKDYFYDDTPLYGISDKPTEILEDLAKNPQKIKDIIKELFIDNKNRNEVFFTPNASLIAEKKISEDKRAQQFEDSLDTPEKKAEFKKEVEEFNTWSSSQAPKEVTDKIPEVSLDSLKDSKIPTVGRNIETVDSVKLIDNDINTYNINLVAIRFNASHLTKEDVLNTKLLSELLTATDTETQSYEEITDSTTKYFYKLGKGLKNNIISKDKISRKYGFYFEYSQGDSKEVYKTIDNIIVNSSFSKKEEVKRRLVSLQNELVNASSNANNISFLSRNRALSQINPNYQYLFDASKLNPALLVKVNKILGDFDTEYPKLQSKLIELKKKIFNKDKMEVFYANKGNYANFKNDITGLLNDLPNEKYETQNYVEVNKEKEAINVPSENGSSAYVNQLSDLGYEYSGKLNIMSNIADEYLNNVIRVQNGAYGAWFYTGLDNDSLVALSYRDGEVGKTINAFRSLPKHFDTISKTMSQKELNGYILQSMTKYYRAYTPDQLFDISYVNYIYDRDEATYEKEKNETLSTKLEDLNTFKELMTKYVGGGHYSTVNNKELIKEKQNKGDYTKILDENQLK